jgi:hypothetical protein
MGVFWWRKKPAFLDAAARRHLRSNLAELDYDLRRISWDFDRISNPSARGTGQVTNPREE